ncbi:MAG: DUF4019 domain-containing protein [Bryobacteraceae bacterium]
MTQGFGRVFLFTGSFFTALLFTALFWAGPGVHAQDDAVQAARASADSWLELVDAGKYAESWEAAAAIFKKQVSKEQWVDAVGEVRKPLGKVKSRKLASATPREDLPNAPPGQYVIIQFDTVFENREGAVETIVPAQDEAGNWKVSGYFVK